MPTTLEVSGNARLTYTFTDAPTIGTLAETAQILTTRTITNGTGANQANAAWRNRVTIAAGQAYTLELTNLGATAFGFSGVLSLATLKEFFLVNNATATGRHVLVGCIGPNDATAYSAKVGAGGDYRVADYLTGWPVTAGSTDTITIANPTAHAITVDIGLVGVGTLGD